MKPAIIESLRYSANVLAWIMGQNQGKFEGFSPDANSLVSERISSNAVKFTLNGDTAGAYIMFKDIRPNKISSTVYDDPKIISSEIKDAYSSSVSNTSDTVTLSRTYSVTEGTETNVQDDLGVSVAVGISQSVSYGGELYGASGTTELSIDIETSFNHSWGESNSEERSIENSIEVPPMTKATMTATKSKSKLEQNIHYVCDLDYSIEFQNWGVAKFYVDSRGDLIKAFGDEYYNGLFYADDGDDNAQNHANQVGNYLKKITEQQDNCLPVTNTKFTKEIKFDKSVTAEAILKTSPILEYINNGIDDFILNEGTNPKTYTNASNNAEILTVEQMKDYVDAGTWYQSKLLVQYK